MKSRVRNALAVGGCLTCFFLGAVIASRSLAADPAAPSKKPEAGAATAPAAQASAAGKPGPSGAEAERAKKLESLEKRLRDLVQELSELRARPAPQAETASQPKPESKIAIPESWIKTINWRSVGPANMGGRIVDLAVSETDPSSFWVATASGGLLHTNNNGVTFEHQFDRQSTVSIGAVAVAPSDAKIVWVGTGENNPRNSVSYGDGVYKSTDGGKTWQNVGLKESFQVGRIVIHPRDPNTVYVGAAGRLYGPNEERGVFKTTDGGKSWTKVLYVDNKTGVIDLSLHPGDPQTLIAAMWQRQRDEFDSWPGNEVPRPDGVQGYDPIVKWGPGSGLFKTTDGGKTWRKLSKGLPSSALGRIGLDWCRSKPSVVYAIIDCEAIGKGPPPLPVYLGAVGMDAEGKVRLTQVIPGSPAAKAGLQVGDILTTVGGKALAEFDKWLEQLRNQKPGEKIQLSYTRGNETKQLEITLANRPGTTSAVWLGVTGESREGKAYLTEILPNGPAAKAGLVAGDVVLEVEGKPLPGYNELIEQLRSRQTGEKVKLRIARGSETKEVEVTLEDRPGPGGRPQLSDAYLGIQGEDSEGGGARITSVTAEGPAAKAGIQEGDVIQALEGKPVENYEGLVRQLQTRKPGDKLPVTVRRGEQKVELVATLEKRPTGESPTRPYSGLLSGQNPNVQDQQGAKGYEFGGVYRSDDAGETWSRVNSLNARPMYFSQVRVDPKDDRNVYTLGVAQYKSSDGGATFDGDFGRGVHADGHAMWIDPRDGRHIILGTDGGTYVTYDRGANWDHLNHMAIGQFYHVAIAPKQPYCVTGGLQDNGSWYGPNLGKSGGGPINEDWISVGGGDGFMCRVDPDDPDLVYSTSQDGAMGRIHLRTGERASLRPSPPRGAPPYRFNWSTPFILSAHNPRVFYCAGNFVFRSLNRGEKLQVISPEITRTKRGSATALSESPRDANVLYVGTDDGAVWVTRDGGQQWQDVSQRIGLPGPRWVATLEASRFADGRVYAAFDGHRSDDDQPYVCVSEDFGQTWRALRANLPWGSTRCLREDLRNPNLLFVGTEFAVWCSLDRGQSWSKLNTNLPTVAVHEFALHPESGELVAATHGRSLWICDVSALRQIQADHLTSQPALYAPTRVVRWQREPSRGRTNRRFVGENPPTGAQIYYALPQKAKEASLKIMDITGNVVRDLRAPTDPGLHRLAWDLTRSGPQQGRTGEFAASRSGRPPRRGGPPGESKPSPAAAEKPEPSPPAKAEARPAEPPSTAPRAKPEAKTAPAATRPAGPPSAAAESGQRRRGGGPPFGAQSVPNGEYRVVLTVDGKEFVQTLRIERDPTAPAGAANAEDTEEADEIEEQESSDMATRWIDD